MSDEQDIAEALDDEEIVSDNPFLSDDLPGEDFPPDRPLGVHAAEFAEDGTVAQDGVADRAAREEPDTDEIVPVDHPIDLVADSGDGSDREAAMIAEPAETPVENMPGEVRAMHVISEDEAIHGIYPDEG